MNDLLLEDIQRQVTAGYNEATHGGWTGRITTIHSNTSAMEEFLPHEADNVYCHYVSQLYVKHERSLLIVEK